MLCWRLQLNKGINNFYPFPAVETEVQEGLETCVAPHSKVRTDSIAALSITSYAACPFERELTNDWVGGCFLKPAPLQRVGRPDLRSDPGGGFVFFFLIPYLTKHLAFPN